MNTFLSDVALFVAGQSLFLFIIILAVSPIGRTSNRLLAAFILVKFCKFMLFYAGFGKLVLPPPVFLLQNLSFATGPLLYLYVLSLVTENFSWQRHYLWHFLPVLVATVASLLLYDAGGPASAQPLLITADDPENLPRSIHIAVGALWFLGYLILAKRLLPGYERRLRERYSSIEALTLGWLRRIIGIALLAYVLIAMLDVSGMLFNLENEPRRLTELLCYIVLFYVIAINGLRRGLLLEAKEEEPDTGGEPPAEPSPAVAAPANKYQRSALDATTSSQILELADSTMNADEPFLTNDFKLQQLATLIGVSGHDLSQAINTGGQTYYDYVNGYRAQKAHSLISLPRYQHLAMLDIALQAGFSSKSTFYKHFKKRYRQTPAEYRKSLSS